MGHVPWKKSSQALVDHFHEAVDGLDGVEVRQMFGYPAAFVGGNLAAGLHQETLMVRLPSDERAERLADGWSLFEPMPGRPMREYVSLPIEIAADPAVARRWIERAAAYVSTLPPKETKLRRAKRG